jgi:hypothetical protein
MAKQDFGKTTTGEEKKENKCITYNYKIFCYYCPPLPSHALPPPLMIVSNKRKLIK